jgi:pimeloyl-ACP methyl ester carboxylesterase
MLIFFYLFTVLLLVLVIGGIFFAAKVIYPKVIPIERTYQIELENNRFTEDEYQKWSKEDFFLNSPFGYPIACSFFPISGSSKTVVISHGITFSRYGMVKYMPLFRKHGFNILLYDLRNHGLSGGRNTTFGYYEKYDLQILVDWAFQKSGASGVVGTMGESLGAAVTLQHTSLDNRLAFAIADCAYADLSTLLEYRLKAEYRLPRFPLLNIAKLFCIIFAGLDFKKVSPIKCVEDVSTPIFWIHGQNDNYIPPRMSQDMFNAKKTGAKKIFIAPNAAHAESLIKNPGEYNRQIATFLTELHLTNPERD